MSRAMKRACIAVAATVALWAPKAFARCEGDASCTKLDTLLAAPGASPFAAVGSSDVLSPWDAGFGFQLSYLRNPIAVLVPTTGPSGERLALVDRQVTGSWMFALGLGAGLEWGVVLDSVLDATGPGLAGANAGASLRETGIGDVRTNVRWAAIERARKPSDGPVGEGFGLAVAAMLELPTGMSGAFASEHGVMAQPTVTADYVHGPFRAAVDVGARLRKAQSVFDARWGSQALVAAAASYDTLPIPRILSVGVEAWSLPSLVDDRATLDLLGTLSSAPAWAGELMVVAGVGRSFVLAGPDLASPDLRATFAVRYAPRDTDSDGDGLLDKVDRCPNEPGPVRDTETPGCPDRAPEDLTNVAPNLPPDTQPAALAEPPVAASPEPAPEVPSTPATAVEPAPTPAAPAPVEPDAQAPAKATP